jgi:hypothetical protein
MDDAPNAEERLAAFKSSLIKGCEDHWIFMVPSSLGEVATVCALSGAFKQKFGGKVCIVAADNRRTLYYMFRHNIDAMRFAPKNVMRALSASKLLDPLRFEVGYPQNLWVNQNRDGRSLALHELFIEHPARGGLSFPDLIRYALNLNWDAKISQGIVHSELSEAAWKLASDHGLEPNNSVVLFPGNNTNKPAGASFWNALSRSYVAAGKKVFYCLTGAYTTPANLDIPGVELKMNPGLALAVSEVAGHMVTGANGLMFLSLLTRSSFAMDVVLTDGKVAPGQGALMPADPALSSTFRCAPELVTGISRRYAEWVVRSAEDPRPVVQAMARAASGSEASRP